MYFELITKYRIRLTYDAILWFIKKSKDFGIFDAFGDQQ